MVEVTKRLKRFGKNEGSDSVSVLVEILVTDGDRTLVKTRTTEHISDDALQKSAREDGKNTWDEDVLCRAGGYSRG